MTKTNRKSILTITAAVIGAIIFCLSFILIVNGSVDVDGDAPQDMDFEYGVDSAISYNLDEIRSWFTLSPIYGSDDNADTEIPTERIQISISENPSGSWSTVNGFTFNPNEQDVGKTFRITFNVQGNDNEEGDGSRTSHAFDITVINPRNTTPSITIDYANEALTGFVSGGDYTINGNAYNNVTEPVAIVSTWFETDLSIIHIGDDNHSDSLAQSLYIPGRPSAPTLEKTDETSFGLRDGKITGLDISKKYEYSSNGTTWTEYGPGLTNISYLSPRTYYVRLAATVTDFASTATEKTINPAPFVSSLVLDSEKGLTYGGYEAISRGVLPADSYTWNSGTKTLTLNGVNYTTEAQYALDLSAYNSDVNLVLTGSNSFTSTYNGTLNTGGIISYETLTVSGTGSLSATGGTGSASSAGLRIQARTLVVNSGTVTLTGGNSTNQSNGVYGSVTINGGNVTISGDNQAIYSGTGTINAPAYSWTSSGPSPSGTYPSSALTIGTQTEIAVTSLTGVSTATATFNKAYPEDLTLRYSLASGVTFEDIEIDGESFDYTESDNVITIAEEDLEELDNDTYTITLVTTAVTDPTVTLTVADFYEKGLVLKSDGLYYGDEAVAMVTNDSRLGGSYAWNGTTNTLTLTNVNFTTTAVTALDLTEVDGVKVSITNTNSFTSTSADTYSYGIKGLSFSVEGSGSLTLTGGRAGIGLNANDTITQSGGTITLYGSRGIESYNSPSSLVMTGGVLNIDADDYKWVNIKSPVVYPAAYTWTSDTGSGSMPNGTSPTSTKSLTITTATGVTPTTATFNKAEPADVVISYSLAAGTTFTNIANGTTPLTEDTHYTKTGNTITILSTYLNGLSNATYTFKLNTSSDVDPTVSISVTRIFDKSLVLNAATNKLEYNDMEVTQDTLGGGSYTYVSGTKTLTLDDVNFTTSAERGLDLSNVQYVTLNLIGANSITATGTGDKYAIYSGQSFSIDGAGSLTATSGVGTTDSIAISSLGSITINGGTITATAGTASYSFGIFANGNIDINGGEITAIGVTKAFNTAPTLPAAYEWETEDDDGEYPFDAFVYNDEEEVYIKAVPLQTRIYSTDLTFDKLTANDIDMEYTLASGVTLQNVQIDGSIVTYDSSTPNHIVIDDAVISALSLSLGNHTIKLVTSGADPEITLTVTAVYADPLQYQDGTLIFQAGAMTKNNEKFGGGSYDYTADTDTLTMTNINYTNNSGAALYIDTPVTVNVVGTNIWRTVSASGTSYAIGGNVPLVLDGTGTLIAETTNGKAFSQAPTILMDNYTWEAIDSSGVRTTGTNNYVYSETHRKVTIAYKAPDPIPDPPEIDLGEPDVSPPREDEFEPELPEPTDPDDNGSEESNLNLKVNGEMTDTSVAMPVEPGDKTADVKINGETVETYSLTVVEAIADGEVSEAFVSPNGAIAGVTVGGNVIAGANETGSLNSYSTIEALETAAEAAVEAIAAAASEDGETPETPILTISTGQDVIAVSDNTIEKILAVSDEYGVSTQIQKTQYSEDENGAIDELIYKITIPVEEANVRDIYLGAEFSTKIVEASKIAFEKTFGNTDCAGFALTQKDTFGTKATIQVKMSAIGFEAVAGETVYVAIFDPKTGDFVQVEGIVGENGFITFITDKSGVVVISATSFTK